MDEHLEKLESAAKDETKNERDKEEDDLISLKHVLRLTGDKRPEFSEGFKS